MNQTIPALERFEAPGDEEALMTRADFACPEPEEVLTCPGYSPEIRWRPGERLDHLFTKRFALLRQAGAGGRTAVTASDGELSFDQLDQTANRLARVLIAAGVRPGDRLGLLFSRSLWAYVAMLAVMKAGAAYVPLDPGFPQDRIAFIAEDAAIARVLTTDALRPHLDGLDAEVIALDRLGSALEHEPADDVALPAPADQLCYIIYTSGSTGKP